MKNIVLLILLLTCSFVFANEENKDYYYECYELAEMEYSNSGATLSGFGSGFLLGLIGTGLGYLVVSNQGVDVPYEHLKDLDSDDRMDCKKGYSEYVKKKRKGGFLTGGGLGTLLAVIVVSSAY
tara:strand:+ start:177 stop:548 length:372 start_codon:yes stop_codon:yes gene_type:complete